jgi:hypothetical protein
MTTTKTYNGHRNWTYWNVALWIGNDEGLYRLARELVRRLGRRQAARAFVEECGMEETKDGAKFTQANVYAAMEGLE